MDISTAYQHGISGIQSVEDPDSHWTPDSSSFVALAACRRDQTTKEDSDQGLGLFTGVLLERLGSEEVDENTTFDELIAQVSEKIGMWQEPVAHGDRKHLRLWFQEC